MARGTMGFFICLLAGWISAPAFAKKLPDHFITPDVNPPPERPLAKYFCGAGQDPEGMEQAKALAKAAVANKVQSSIAAELETVLEQQAKNDKVSVSSSYREQVKQSTRFDHAELIEVVDVQKFKRSWYAVSCLQRKAAGHAVLDGLRPTLQKHGRAYKRAQAALENDDPSGFVVAYRTASSIALEARGPGVVLNTLVGEPSEYRAFMDHHRALGDQAAELREAQTFAVRVRSKDGSKDVERAVGNATQEALTRLDLDAGRIQQRPNRVDLRHLHALHLEDLNPALQIRPPDGEEFRLQH